MSDVSVAPEQDAIAESLLGEPEEQQTVEQSGTEQPEALEQDTQQVEAESEVQEEVAEDWLPTDQDKVFPDEIYARYAKRYDLSPEDAANPSLRQLLTDKINTDIFVRQQQQAEQFQEPEPEPQPEPTQLSYEQHFANIDRMIAERTDPQVAKDFHSGFLRTFGVPEAQIAQASPQQAQQFTSLMSKYALNLFTTFFPDMLSQQLGSQISQAYPGFGEMYERSSYAMAWDQVRNSNPQFSNLPAYGTKEFSKTLREAAARIPGFDEMQFTDPQGKALPPQQNAQRKYSMLAQMASGQNVDPQLLQKAAAAGASNARRAAVKRSAGNLGSGQSANATGRTNSSKFQTNQDIFDDETMEMWNREHGRL